MAGFLGMRGTESWATDQRPLSWRMGILLLYPNGSAPLTAMLAAMGKERLTDPEHNWWTKVLSTQAATVTGIFTDELSTALASNTVASGTALWLQMSEAHMVQFRVGHQVLLRDATDYLVDTNAKVTAIEDTGAGASSFIKVSTLEAAAVTASGYGLINCDAALIVGNINEEGATMPAYVSYDPTKLTNRCQIFRNPLNITRTASLTSLRTGDALAELKREALEYHSIEMEKAFFFGINTENTGTGGFPERTTGGIIDAITTNASGNVDDFTLNTDYSAKNWTDANGGKKWLNEMLEVIFRYGGKEKIAFCGSGALLGIQELAETFGTVNLKPGQKDWGIEVVTWITPFGTLHLKTHPLFSQETTNRYSMVITELKNLKYRYITDTTYKKHYKDGTNFDTSDALKSEFLTECLLEFHYPQSMGFLNGVGKNNTLGG